jgi:predicted unusual protein kinase regulating ubiquinone biosynthesis (AarF/ABC1/UbiB family)
MSITLRPERVRRYGQIARLLVKYGRADFVRSAGLDDALEGQVEDVELADEKPEELAADLERLGPTFIKLGQLLSTRADFLPVPYLVALARLQDDVEPFPYEQAREIVETELGVRISNAFSSFDPHPVASASLAQVHRAQLRDGRPVAVKVQRPDIRDQIALDMDTFEELAAMAERHTDWGRRYGLAAMVAEFRRSLVRELDYRLEAQNLRTLGADLQGLERIVVPQPVDGMSGARVLTMDFISGASIGSLGPLALMDIDGPRLAGELFQAYLKQILEDGFFHADPHPGNIFVTDEGRLALLDLGMVATVERAQQDRLVKLLLAVADQRGSETADVLIEMGQKGERFDEETFHREVGALVSKHRGQTVENLHAGTLIANVTRISVEAGLRPPPELTMLGKALLNLDEVTRRLDPGFDPNAALAEHTASLLRSRMLSSVSPSGLFSAALDAKEFAERLPGRVNKVMDALAEGRLTLQVQGIDEKELMRAAQKVANRVTTGVVIAALVIGASMLMRVQTKYMILGYPALAIICFLAAASGGFALLVAILLNDRRH